MLQYVGNVSVIHVLRLRLAARAVMVLPDRDHHCQARQHVVVGPRAGYNVDGRTVAAGAGTVGRQTAGHPVGWSLPSPFRQNVGSSPNPALPDTSLARCVPAD